MTYLYLLNFAMYQVIGLALLLVLLMIPWGLWNPARPLARGL